MDEKNIIAVIEELGNIILVHKEVITNKQNEIDKLKRTIESIEQYAAFYSEDHIHDEEYSKVFKK